MRASTRRAIRAVLCWPLGVLLVAVWMFAPLFFVRGDELGMEGRTQAEISTSSSGTSIELKPSSSETATLLILLLGPGLLATHSWWTRRKEE